MFEKVSLHATPLTPNDLSLYLFQQKLQSFLYNGQVDLTLNVNLLHFLYYPNLKIVSLVNEFLPYVWLYFREYLLDRKSTRLNSSHVAISYAVFCLKKT